LIDPAKQPTHTQLHYFYKQMLEQDKTNTQTPLPEKVYVDIANLAKNAFKIRNAMFIVQCSLLKNVYYFSIYHFQILHFKKGSVAI